MHLKFKYDIWKFEYECVSLILKKNNVVMQGKRKSCECHAWLFKSKPEHK